jgi:hypothetical protein
MSMKQKCEFIQEIKPTDVDTEDSGCAIICHVDGEGHENEDTGMFVRLQSWDDDKKHVEIRKFIGRKVKITVETVD